MKSVIKIVVITIVILGLVLPLLTLRAEEIKLTKSQLLEQINAIVAEITALKNDQSFSDDEREKREITLQKEALSKVFDLSILEIGELKEKLQALELENEEQEVTRDRILTMLEKNEGYCLELKQKLDNGELTLKDLKGITKDFQQWRKIVYGKNITLVLNFILVFSERSALTIADKRLEKITNDLNKLDNAKLITKYNLQGLLSTSIQHLTQAHLLNKKAQVLLISSASTTLANLEQELLTIYSQENQDVPGTNEIRSLVKQALEEIKAAYKNFFTISDKVKQQLGF